MRPINMGALKIFGTRSLTMPTATFPKILWAFVPTVQSERALVSSYRPPYILFLDQHSVVQNFKLQFSVGVANPKFWGRGGHRGSGWYRSKERC